MSGWLKNVGSFLEKLDDRAERVAEDRTSITVGEERNVLEDVQLQSILNARGLVLAEEEEAEEDDEKVIESNPTTTTFQKEIMVEKEEGIVTQDKHLDETVPRQGTVVVDVTTTPMSALPVEESLVVAPLTTNEQPNQSEQLPEISNAVEGGGPTDDQGSAATSGEMFTTPRKNERTNAATQDLPKNGKLPPDHAPSSDLDDTNASGILLSPNTHAAFRELQKEARTLRRHVVALNKQLEHAETELQAQRVELERAAERLEKDRIRYKEDREKEKNRHAEEIKTLKLQNEKAMKEIKQRSDKQIEEIRTKLREVEERRMQEGGDWNKELLDAVQREQEIAQKFALVEDEKATLLSQIAILQDQQEALGNRLESLTQTAENAMEREREADNRLDETLNLHARQIAQRQARESELERTIADLGAALVVARARTNPKQSQPPPPTPLETNPNHPMLDSETGLTLDTEVLVAQLDFERQRCETLQNELRDISKERNDEATANHVRQIKYDRQMAELSHTVARLEAELRTAKNNKPHANDRSLSKANPDDAKHLRELSEEVLRQREKLANSNSEIAALKSRLQSANARIKTTEAALEAAESRLPDTDDWRGGDLEQSPASGGLNGGGGVGGVRRRGGPPRKKLSSMRAALHLDSIKSSEQIGRALDVVDAFLVSSGRFLSYNALARLLFISYLLLLHFWTFILIVLHTHNFETVHGDFGAGEKAAHGPHALMRDANLAAAAAASDVSPTVQEGVPNQT